MEVYETLDEKRFFRVSLVDTEKLMQEEWRIKDNALAEEVEAKEPYVRAFVDFLLGNVIKCASVDELRQCKIGVTADCLLYQLSLIHIWIAIYYGAADSYVGLAFTTADEIISYIKEHSVTGESDTEIGRR